MLPTGFQRISSPQINPLWRSAEDAFDSYARRTAIIACERDSQLMLSFRFGWFTAACYPELEPAQLNLLTQWHYMYTIIDDVGDKADPGGVPAAVELRKQILHTVTADGPPTPGCSPAVSAFYDLWQRTRPYPSEGWKKRMLADLANYLAQFAPQRQNRDTNRILSLEDYIDLRRVSVGLDPNADTLELILGIDLPEPIFATPLFRELRNCFVDANAWINDYYSFDREIHENEPHNLAIVIANETGCAYERALQQTLDMITERLHRFLRIEQKIPTLIDSLDYDKGTVDNTLRYCAALKDYTYGHVLWSSTSSRYNAARLRAPDWA
ncbi:terpene synthase family protein [Nocardia brasiliensis]|uniref:terpene synthase family protein n=1 Tax=Nocardia brasiliensis TaxID=37326 RepID=UPI0024563B41|nr:hypothetical protein [Nocardia brasiliensis]